MIGTTNAMGGGGITSDETNVTRDKVLSGATYLGADTNDEVGIGTMVDRGNWTTNVSMNGSVTIPVGKHGGSGKVTGPIVTQRGAPTYTLPINGTQNLPEGYYTGGKITQSIATMGAQTLSPQTYAQTVSSSGKYMTGNVVVNGVVPPPVNVLAEGYVYMGVTGTAKVIPSNSGDIYNRGTSKYGINVSNYKSGGSRIDAGQLTISCVGSGSNTSFNTKNVISAVGCSTLYIEHSVVTESKGINIIISIGGVTIWNVSEAAKMPSSISLVNHQLSGIFEIKAYTYEPNTGSTGKINGPIFRIWLE